MKARFILFAIALAFASCAHRDRETLVRVSVPNQKMIVFKQGVQVAKFDCSTSKYGVGDRPGSYCTPLGRMEVAQKIGGNLPSGMKLKNRRPTGEIVRPNSPGRDPIVSRILWLRGLERRNAQAFRRTIYIHGTAEERTIGSPASYGCIRMRSKDVIQLYKIVGVGATVEVMSSPFPAPLVQQEVVTASATATPAVPVSGSSPAAPKSTVRSATPAPAPTRSAFRTQTVRPG